VTVGRVLIASAVVAATGVSAGSLAAEHGASAAPARPNIVLLMTDDQTVESLRVMPNVKRVLADRGTTFDNSFVSFSLCCPSRATLLTGQYAHNHGVLSNQPPGGGYEKLDGSHTLPVWLRNAGYYTAHLGKYLNGYGKADPSEIPPGWSEWRGSVDPSTYQFYGYTLNEGGTLTKFGSDSSSYQTDVYARKAVEMVRRRAASDTPFFLSVAFLAPHSGGPVGPDRSRGTALPAPRHRGRYAAEPLPAPPSLNEADVSDKPLAIRKLPPLNARQIERARERYRLRLESLLAVDEAVAQIVAELSSSGELGNTLIVFTSDNGFFHGEHRIETGKVDLYEPSTRIPLIVRGPGVPAGLRLRQPVANVDLAPTILAAAGAKADRRLDGRSLWTLLGDPGIFWGRDLLHEGPGRDAASRRFIALRTPHWVYARHLTGEEELYDLQKDSHQLRSLHADAPAAATKADLMRRLAALAECSGDGCRREPSLSLAVGVVSHCRVEILLGGKDVGEVSRVRFSVDGNGVSTDRRAPYVVSRRLGSRSALLRAHAVLTDGRELTRDQRLSACR
jgi:arylsulfatase A-like enzyme